MVLPKGFGVGGAMGVLMLRVGGGMECDPFATFQLIIFVMPSGVFKSFMSIHTCTS